MQEAAMEDHVASAPEHGRLLAIAVRPHLLSCLRRVRCHGRYMFADFAFQNSETRIAKMRVGNAPLPPQGGSH